MKITLRNFKQYPDYSLEIPDKGLILLKGETGKGKTTLFEAVYDAITGGADDVVPWTGEKPVEVEIEFQTIRIKRTHNPETLECEIEEFQNDHVTYTGDAAQAKIYEFFTAHTAEFTAAYYIRQRMEGSLLSFGATQMLRFIQKMAFGDQDPEVLKQKIKTLIDKRLLEKTQTEFRLAQASQRVNELEARLVVDRANVGEKPSEGYAKAKIDELNNEISILKSDIVEFEKSIDYFLNSKVVAEVNAARDSLDEAKKRLESLTELNQPQINELTARLEQFANFSATEAKQEAKQKQEALKAKRAYIAWRKEVDDLSKQIVSVFPDFKSSAVDFLAKKIIEANADTSLKDEMDSLRSQIAENLAKKHNQFCPQCEAPLVVEGGVIKPKADSGHYSEETHRALSASLQSVISKTEERNRYLSEITILREQAKNLKNRAVANNMPEIATEDEIDVLEKEAEVALTSASMKEQSIRYEKEQLNRLTAELVSRRAEVAKLEEQVGLGAKQKIPNRAEIANGVREYNADIKVAMDKIALLNADLAKNDAAVAQAKEWSKLKSMVESREKELEAAVEAASVLTDQVFIMANKWSGAVRLKELSDSAAIGATEGIINAINQYAEKHISTLFPHGGTAIRINSGSTTAKGEDRSKLSLSVTHKGQVVGKTINPLSGGEKDRVKVAFQLALAEIYQAKFMMLDEPFAGIDVENTLEICLALLKDFSEGRLIVMAQHGAPEGVFDAVINL